MNDHMAAIGRVQAAIGAVVQDAQSQAQGSYRYRSITGLINALHPVLVAEGVVIAAVAQEVLSDSGSRLVVRVTYQVASTDPDAKGDPLKIVGIGIGQNQDKSPGSAFSYAYKSVVGSLFSIPTDNPADDPDYGDPVPASGWWGGWHSKADHDRDRSLLLEASQALSKSWKNVIRFDLEAAGIIDKSGAWKERITVDQAGRWDELLQDVEDKKKQEPFGTDET